MLLQAQEGRFGFIDFNSTLKLMPGYMEAQINLQKIQSDYRGELERSKREFERQYVEFMLEQDNLSPTIVAKRQRELQLLMDNNAKFKNQVLQDIEERRDELLVPLKKQLMEAVALTCVTMSLDYVIDTGTGTYLFINGNKGVDISNEVYAVLGIETLPERILEAGTVVTQETSSSEEQNTEEEQQKQEHNNNE